MLYNVIFYGSWFSQENIKQFDLAHKLLNKQGIKAGDVLMDLEMAYAPNPKRFADWAVQRAKEWNQTAERKDVYASGTQELAALSSTVRRWKKALPKDAQDAVGKEFDRTLSIARKNEDAFNRHGILATAMFFSNLASCASQGIPKPSINEILSAAPDAALSIMDEENLLNKPLLEEDARTIWQFFVRNHPELYRRQTYWSEMRNFLEKNPAFVPKFLSSKKQWFSFKADIFNVYYLYRELLRADVIPPANRREVYLTIIDYEGRHSESLNPESYKTCGTLDEIEKKLVKTYLVDIQKDTKGRGRLGLLEDIARHLLKKFIKEWSTEKTIAFLRSSIVEDSGLNADLSARILRLARDKSRTEAKSFLGEFQDRKKRNYRAAEHDPFWDAIWHACGCGLLFTHNFSGGIHAYEDYDTAMAHIPESLLDLGFETEVRDLYFKNHPYAAIYALPEDLRPTGRGVSYAIIDSFPPPGATGYADLNSVRILDIDPPVWTGKDEESHGIAMSTLAVGKTMGLAPGANLYIAPAITHDTVNPAKATVESFARTIELKKNDPSLAVVGLSLGLEVPIMFKKEVQRSELYKRLKRYCEELHRAGVAIIVSAGNDGQKDNINMLGLLPHVTLVGALDSKLTETRDDDRASSYSTGRGSGGPAQLYAHADPVMLVGYDKKTVWSETGGTSSA
ncbi:MAG: S8/S53 family peptidase, partial [Pseudomonadota bacterium]